MADDEPGRSNAHEREWFIVGRWQEYQAEVRANLLRIVGIGSFYIIELMNYYGVDLGPLQFEKSVNDQFHFAVTGLAVAWTMAALATHLCLRRHVFPEAMKYLTTGGDIVLLTAILTVADGPRSPLVVGYFLILSAAALRVSLPLIRWTTLGTMAAYVFLLGFAKWQTARDITVPRYYELIMLLALALSGVILGQLVRRVRSMADDYARRLAALPKA